MTTDENDSQGIADLLQSIRTIAVVGIKDRPNEDAYRVPLYMREAGYQIVAVNPKFEEALGQKCHSTLADVEEAIDVVDLFRASENIADHVDEILALDPLPKAVWMQLGIHHGPSAQRLRDAGIDVIQDRCIMVDHRRLLGSGA